MNKFQVFNTLAFVVFCFAIGEVIAILLTGLIYNVNTSQIFEALTEPVNSNKSLIILFSSLSTLFRFLVIPALYLLFINKSSLSFLWTNNKIRFAPLIITVALVFSLLPFISILIELNYKLELPIWLSELERYFQESEEKARLLTSLLLSFREFKDLIITILIVAIIPGVVEEFFFRGMVQMQLQNILKNHHYAIFFSAFLFSCFHFQFYGFIPRMVLGVLFGYIFFWSKNIWYPSAAHVTHNLIGVLGAYFFGPQLMNPQDGNFMSMALLFPSVIISVLVILYLRKILIVKSKGEKEITPCTGVRPGSLRS